MQNSKNIFKISNNRIDNLLLAFLQMKLEKYLSGVLEVEFTFTDKTAASDFVKKNCQSVTEYF